MNKFRAFLGGGLVIAVLVYSAGWYYFSLQFEKHVEEELTFYKSKGLDIKYDHLSISGFPLGYDVHVKNLIANWNNLFKTWVDGDITFSAKLWKPNEISSVAGGTHHVELEDISSQGDGFQIKSLTLDPLRFKFSYEDLVVLKNSHPVFSAKEIEYDIDLKQNEQGEKTTIYIRFEKLDSPAFKDSVLGEFIEEFTLEANLQGNLEGINNYERLQHWHETEGTLDISRMSLKWGTLKLEGEGTFSIDQDLQPIAAFAVSFEGLNQVIDQVVEREYMTKETAALIKLAANFLGGPDSKIALSIQDQSIRLADIPILRLPKIEWR